MPEGPCTSSQNGIEMEEMQGVSSIWGVCMPESWHMHLYVLQLTYHNPCQH